MPDTMGELGNVGLKLEGGQIGEEFLAKLRGAAGRKVYREMSDNDAVIGGMIFAFEKTVGRLNWHMEAPEDASPAEDDATTFAQECLEDMSESFTAILQGVMSMIPYGWTYHEIVYKRRNGEKPKPGESSRHNDGRIGWRKWPIRSQNTLVGWVPSEDGGIAAMKQKVDSQPEATIPIEKALLFRTTTAKGNPEGRSLIRNAYRPWYMKKRIEEIEAVGIERDLAGLPVAWVDPKYLSPNASQEEKDLLNAVSKMVQSIKRNETEGIVFPLDHDESGNKTIDLTLLSSGGSRQFDTDKIVGRYNQQIAMSVLADFLLLGHEGVGSHSLGTSKIELWMMAVDALAKSIAEVVNAHAIPRLLRLNGMKVERPPRLVYGAVEQTDLKALATYVKSLTDAGAITPDPSLEAHLRELGDLPPAEEDREDMEADSGDPAGAPPAPPAGDGGPPPSPEEQQATEDAAEAARVMQRKQQEAKRLRQQAEADAA